MGRSVRPVVLEVLSDLDGRSVQPVESIIISWNSYVWGRMVLVTFGSKYINCLLLYYSTLDSILLYLYIMSISNYQYISRETNSMLSDLLGWGLYPRVENNLV